MGHLLLSSASTPRMTPGPTQEGMYSFISRIYKNKSMFKPGSIQQSLHLNAYAIAQSLLSGLSF